MKIKNKHISLLLFITIIVLLSTAIHAEDTDSYNSVINETSSTDNIDDTNKNNIEKTYEDKTDDNTDTPTDTTTITKTDKTLKSDETYQTIYVSSKGLSTNIGNDESNPTTLENALDYLENNGTVILTSDTTEDTYKLTTAITYSRSYYSTLKNFSITADATKNITISGDNISNLFTINSYNISISNINFINSYSKNYSAITIKNSNITINNCNFTNNDNANYGSCISLQSSKLTIKKSNFKNNSASYGGVIYAIKSNMTITSTKFINNSAKYYGGAILHIDSSKLSISSSNFTSNNASMGGAIYIMQANLTAKQTTFESNNAYLGGSIYSYNNTVTIKNNCILNNKLNDSLIHLLLSQSYDINENWWGINNPNFNLVTNNIYPDSWILMTFTNTSQTTNNTQNITVSLNTLSNSSNTSSNIQKRTVKFTSSEGNFTYTKANIQNTFNNTYTGNDTIYATIDNQLMTLNSKILPTFYISNYSASYNDTINITIKSNADLTGKINLTINNKTMQLTASSSVSKTYNVTSEITDDTYIINATYLGNSKYNKTTSIGYLFIQESSIDKTNKIVATLNKTDSYKSIPSYYSLLDEGYMTSVKEQGSSGSCVVFAAIGAVESSIKRLSNESYDLSENNMKNMFKKYSTLGFSELTPNEGGYDMEPVGYMASGYGPILESSDYYNTQSHISSIFNTSFQIQNIYFIPARTGYLDNDGIKEAILKYGPVYTGVRSSSSLNQYHSDVNSSNHAVIIVGWNDTYSKENFDTTPPGDGAFIIKNSWGSSAGDGGYQYVSYYDSVIGNIPYVGDYNSVNFVVDYNNSYNYTGLYQYDDICYVYEISDDGGEYWIVNDYNATRNETIAAIGTYFVDCSDYEIKVYVNNKLITTKKGTIDIPGYRTIQLDNIYRISEHDKITVNIHFKQYIDDEYLYIPLQDTDYPIYSGANVSFISFDGEDYDDLYDYTKIGQLCAPIKVYTMDVASINCVVKNINNTLNITTNVSNMNSSGRLYYKINGDLVRNSNGKIRYTTINGDANVSFTCDVTNLTSGNYTLETVFVYDGLNVSQTRKFSVVNNISIKSVNITTKINDTNTLIVNVTVNNKKATNGTVYLRYSNSTLITSANVKSGQANLTFIMPKSGTFTPTIEYVVGNNSAYTIIKIVVNKLSTKLSINKSNTYVYNKSVITGTLTDSNNKSISNAYVYVYINDDLYRVKTNSTGGYKITYLNTVVATNNITVKYEGSSYYKPSNKSATYKSLIMSTKVTVSTVKGILQENITLTAKIVDKYNNSVINGYVIFKINGITVKDNGQLNGSSSSLKVYVEDGVATTNITAYLNIRHGKNITCVYSGSTTYNASRSNTATAEIKLRTAQIVVTTNTTRVKQDAYIKFTARVYDVSNGNSSSTLYTTDDQYVYFKVNGITIKSSNGSALQVKIINGVATYNYKVPVGLSCITDGKTKAPKYHTVIAGFYNPNYYPGTTNTTNFTVERSKITINITKTTVYNKTHTITIKGTIKDYNSNYVVGPNKVVVKINGVTLKDSKNNTRYFTITNGLINLSNITIASYNTYSSITLVTQDRLAYLSARATSTNITVLNR